MRDSCGISPYSVTPESNIKVVTEKEDYQLKRMENMFTVVTV